ncbi:MAG: hypothetical protein RI568_06985 [Natronomonas sp.]|uniref:Uncharacterized protein n=1 Tax=Natronomonas salsuginis TaxID=2217661 RepID=A0A4U5J7A4_9EURY|nr:MULTISPECIES: hypothetical protein [Natronomonas]MDR9430431.1 hypothetical protein [Natronomonas sp.]TKR24922.1 hypothetical protein DM868_13410 [Natronomonas salsuginis]
MKHIPDRTAVMRVVLSIMLVVAAVGAVATPAAAQSDQPDWAVEMFEDMQPMVETYNENVNRDDFGFMATQLQDQDVNLVVDDPANGSEASVSFTLDDDLRMQEVELGPRDDATLRMDTDKATMDEIIASDSPEAEFRFAVVNDDITISGIGTFAMIKWVVIDVVAVVLRGIFG